MKLGDKNIVAAYLGDVNVFTNYYGVSFPIEPLSTLLTRTGYMPWHKELPIHSKMKSCTITSDGTVKYLNATDRTKYEDGTDRDMTLNTMVEIPEFWYKCMRDDTTVYLNLYPADPHIPEAEHVEKFYISAYEASNVDNVLKSINNGSITPVVNINRTTMQSRARANNSSTTNWNMYTYRAHRILTVLYLVEYACTNSLKAFNAELTAEGYHQGGLGDGITTGNIKVNGVDTWSCVPCGSTDEHGNFTGITPVTVTSTDAEGTATQKTYSVPTYRGIENPFGHVWKNCIDTLVHFNAQTNKDDVYINTELSTFGSTDISDYDYQCSTAITEGYKKKLVYNAAFDILPPIDEAFGGSTTTYWCDYNWTNNSTTDKLTLIGGRAGAGARAGLLNVDFDGELGGAYAGVGTRLIYIP
ncbi:tail protein [uncultured phage cr109_1]|uniref:Sulfatase-like protein n=1 Tax=uncultured phage cr109_1 TaxID=2772083 RepID=A0A7M1RRX6_9CAUD|nr:tail protein [uncultured phage cr109_1]QOR57036.1 sulfatase-like protein [uncultured phage cr109_1]